MILDVSSARAGMLITTHIQVACSHFFEENSINNKLKKQFLKKGNL